MLHAQKSLSNNLPKLLQETPVSKLFAFSSDVLLYAYFGSLKPVTIMLMAATGELRTLMQAMERKKVLLTVKLDYMTTISELLFRT
jgi:hypothetical protein